MNYAIGKLVDRWLGITALWILARIDSMIGAFRRHGDRPRIEHVLLIKLWGVGNVALLLPIIKAIKGKYPATQLTFLTLRGNEPLLAAMPELQSVIVLPTSSLLRFAFGVARAVVRLRAIRLDVVVDFEQFCRVSALIARATGAPHRIGLRTPGQARHELYTAQVPYDDTKHMTETFFDVARVLGVEGKWRPVAPNYDDSSRRQAEEFLRTHVFPRSGRFVVMHVGSGANFEGRRWPVAKFERLATEIVRRHDVAIVLTGVASERELIEGVRSEVGDRAVSACAQLDLLAMSVVLSRAVCLFSNDTAPVHLASLVGTPVFGFYGPNTPVLYGPVGVEGAAFYKALPCSPCLTNLNAKESSCRLPICIQSIAVEEVLQAFDRFMSKGDVRCRSSNQAER